MVSTQTLLNAVFFAASVGGLAMCAGAGLADGCSRREHEAGMAMVAKARDAGAVCQQTGPLSFQVVDRVHHGKPFYAMTGEWNHNTGTVDGWAQARDGSPAQMSVNLESRTCHVPFGISGFKLMQP